jgi:hypothetical protein
MNLFKLITTSVFIMSLSVLSACVTGRSGWGRGYDHDDGSRDGDNYRHTLAYQHPTSNEPPRYGGATPSIEG